MEHYIRELLMLVRANVDDKQTTFTYIIGRLNNEKSGVCIPRIWLREGRRPTRAQPIRVQPVGYVLVNKSLVQYNYKPS